MFTDGSASLQLFLVVWIFLRSQKISQKLIQWLVSPELTVYLSIFNLSKLNELWPYYQKHINQVILNHTTLWSLALWIFEALVWILLIVNLSLNNSPDILGLCESNLDDSIDSDSFSVRGYLPLIRKSSSTHIHGLALYVKEGLPYLEKTLQILIYVFDWLYFTQCLTSFSSINHLLLCAQFLILFHLT